MPALSLQETADELRFRASRLREEMDFPPDPSSSDGKGPQIWLMLAVAMLDAARAEWEKLAESWPEIRDVAKELALKERIEVDRLVSGNPGQPPCIARVPRVFRQEGDPRLAPVLEISMNLAGMRPIWACYLQEAREELDRRATASPELRAKGYGLKE